MSKTSPFTIQEQLNLLERMEKTAPTEEMKQELAEQIKELKKKIAENE
jgi:DNA-binding transcriptional MerR regulator